MNFQSEKIVQSSIDSTDACFGRAISSVVSAILSNSGYTNCEPKLLGILNEMLQSILIETGRLSKSLAEHAGRTQPILSDIQLALIEMGIDVSTIPDFAQKEANKIILLPPLHQVKPPELKILKSGPKQQLSYVPDYFPELPDTRTYINTPVLKSNKDEYKMLREKNAIEKRDIEKAYTKYLAKTGQTCSLFDDKDTFPLIANSPNLNIPPFIPALLGKYSYGPWEYLNDSDSYIKENGSNISSYIPFYIPSDQSLINEYKPEVSKTDKEYENTKEIGPSSHQYKNLRRSFISPHKASEAGKSADAGHSGVPDQLRPDGIDQSDPLDPTDQAALPDRKNYIDSLIEDNPYVRFLEKNF